MRGSVLDAERVRPPVAAAPDPVLDMPPRADAGPMPGERCPGERCPGEQRCPDGFDERFLAILPELRRGVYRVVGPTEDSEEILQDLYLRLRSGPAAGRFLIHPNPVGYSVVIVRNLLRDRWRQRSRTQAMLARMAGSADPRWDGGLRLREAELEVMSVLEQLTARQAAAVGLVDVDGHTLDDAAKLLGLHKGSVHRHRLRGLEKLRNRMPERCPS